MGTTVKFKIKKTELDAIHKIRDTGCSDILTCNVCNLSLYFLCGAKIYRTRQNLNHLEKKALNQKAKDQASLFLTSKAVINAEILSQ